MTLRSRRKPPITVRNTRQTNSLALAANLVCLAAPLLALAIVQIAAPARAGEAVVQAAYTSGQSASSVVQVSYTVGESGHKFKWTPYRPTNRKKVEPLRANAAQYTAPSAAAEGLHPLDDPFADEEQPAGQPFLQNNLIWILLAIGAGGFAFYYFRIYKPGQEEEVDESENMETGDGFETELEE